MKITRYRKDAQTQAPWNATRAAMAETITASRTAAHQSQAPLSEVVTPRLREIRMRTTTSASANGVARALGILQINGLPHAGRGEAHLRRLPALRSGAAPAGRMRQSRAAHSSGPAGTAITHRIRHGLSGENPIARPRMRELFRTPEAAARLHRRRCFVLTLSGAETPMSSGSFPERADGIATSAVRRSEGSPP
jgi:hypothetical protein